VSSPHPKSHQKAGIAFLLAQIGAHGAEKFAERLEPLKLTPVHAGILRMIEHERGISQQRLASLLGMFPSRLVLVLDSMEEMELIERRASARDRRTYALHLTVHGRNRLKDVGAVAKEHQNSLCNALSPAERSTLSELLSRIADDQGLTPGVHPGYKHVGDHSAGD
jgi:DNA-binding MarR family transcriptional regulator